MPTPEDLYNLLLLAAPLVLSLTIHEYAHARTALAFGDPTAKHLGRCTLNPLAHLDPIGTIALFVVHFGWAKPVPVNPHNLDPPRLGDIAVSLAGPLSNLALAILSGLLLRAWFAYYAEIDLPTRIADALWVILYYTMSINLVLCLFNLIPLFPLDGHHILRESLPKTDQRVRFMAWQMRYGRILLLALIFGPRLASFLLRRPVVGPIGAMFRFVIEPFTQWMLGMPA